MMNAPERARQSYSLRHQGKLVALTRGEFLIGRDTACHFVVQDDLASRTHARIVVNDRGALLEDLGSANGVFLNEARLRKPTFLQAGDRILVGTCQLAVFPNNGEIHTRIISDTLPAQRSSSVPPASGVRVAAAQRAGGPRSETIKADAFQLFGRLADQLMARGDAQGAARLLTGHVAKVIRGAQKSVPVGDELLDVAGRYCLKLAAATKEGVWVDRMVEMHAATRRPLSTDLSRELTFVLRHANDFNRRQLVEYQVEMRKLGADLSGVDSSELAERCRLITEIALP